MFCDLVGSTALSAQLDPEELRDIVRAYQQTSATVIERFDGHIAQYLGDGLLVYFGHPSAHEDDAARAVRAGLGIVEAVQDLNPRLAHPLEVRVGIHTGPVVVGDMGGGSRQEQLALGETPNLAARVQERAAPNEVLVSAATSRLIAGLFELVDRGRQELKGLSTPLPLYRVVRESEAQSRFEVAVRAGLTPLVGREEEVELLRRRWARVTAGEGQVVLLSGEPGIGKSRLLQVLREYTARDAPLGIECRCSPYYQHSALYPVIEHLQRRFRLSRDEPPAAKLHELEQSLATYGFPLPETVPLMAPLLSLALPERYPPLPLSPQKQKEKTLATLVTWVRKEAERHPTRVEIEDLHWADPSTVDWLTLLLEQVPTLRLLVVLTFRPEFRLPWPLRAHMLPLTLGRLSAQQIEGMAQRVAGKALPPEVLHQLVAKTDGVPLFVEEMTKNLLESGLLQEAKGRYELTGPLPPLAIPATLQDSLRARLDRLTTAKEIAQVGATLGREFSYELLQAVSPVEETALQQGLKQLVEAELVYQKGLPPHAQYLFKHALVQDAAYASLLKSTRQQLHTQVARVLEERFAETVETRPELVAHHYTEAGLLPQAIPCWQRAGQRAVQRSAYVEAVAHLAKGLELLKTLPDTPERIQQELGLQTALGRALMVTKGFAAPEGERAYARARELCQQVGETPQLFPVLAGLLNFYDVRGEHQTARELGEQLLSLAQRGQDSALLLEAHHMLGGTLFNLGELTSARVHLEQGVALYDPQQHHSHAFLYGGHDPGVCCLSQEALTLWLLGYPDQALKRIHEALTLAQELSHPLSLAVVLHYAAVLHENRREVQATQRRAEELIVLSREQGFPVWLALGTAMQGWVLAEQGQVEEGIAKLRQGLTAYRATGAELGQPYRLALLAAAYAKAGQVEEGLTVLVEALDAVHKTRGRTSEAELYRLKGTLTLQQEARGWRLAEERLEAGDWRLAPSLPPHKSQASSLKSQVLDLKPQVSSGVEQEAEGYFLKAIEIARRQQAKSRELRAVMSLSRLWQQQGKTAEARQLLAETYGWFTEGFDTADLKEAKALLEELERA